MFKNDKWKENAYKLADWTIAHLVNRVDTYGCYPSGQAKTTHKELTRDKLALHYAGEGSRIGLHSYGVDGQGKWVVIDIDAHVESFDPDKSNANLDLVNRIKDKLSSYGIVPVVDHSNGMGGYKVWIIFDTPCPLSLLRAFGLHLINDHGLSSPPEVFPKQERQTPFGSYVRLFGKHHKKQWLSDVDGCGDNSPEALLKATINPLGKMPTDLPLCLPESSGSVVVDPEYVGGSSSEGEDFGRYKGDLATLDLVALCFDHSKIIHPSGSGFFEVVCPFASTHTTGEGGAFVKNGDGEKWASFHCKHSHCSDKGLADFLLMFDPTEVDIHCSKSIDIKVDPYLSMQARLDSIPDSPPPVVGSPAPVAAPVPVAPVPSYHQNNKDYKYVYSMEELEGLPSPVWLIKKHIQVGTINVVYGQSGSLKSFLAIDMAMAIALGIPFVNTYSTRKGKVAYIAAEGGSGMKARLKVWCINRNMPATPDICVVTKSFDFSSEESEKSVSEAITAISNYYDGQKVDFVVIDTIARNFVGDENNAKDMGRFIRNLERLQRELGCTVLAVHHTGKDDNRGARGSSALKCAVDTMIEAKKTGKGCEISCTKQKDAEFFDTYHLCSVVHPTGYVNEDGEKVDSLALNPPSAHLSNWDMMDERKQNMYKILLGKFDTTPFKANQAATDWGIKSKNEVYKTLDYYIDMKLCIKTGCYYTLANTYMVRQ